MQTGIILQARMGSTRFPGKVLEELDGEPMLCQILRRLRKARKPSMLIVATTLLPADDAIATIATEEKIMLFRGAETDVLDRFWQATLAFKLDHIVRATADNPLVDFEALDDLVETHLRVDADYSTSLAEWNSGFPVGTGVEVFARTSLERSWRQGTLSHHREHVNEYVKEHPDLFKIEVLKAPRGKQAPTLSLTVDTPEDLEFIRQLTRRLPTSVPEISLRDIVASYKMMGYGARWADTHPG